VSEDAFVLLNVNLPWTYRWTKEGRHGQACRIVKRERKSCLIEFADGGQMMVELVSLRRKKMVEMRHRA
jgi:hypothetical protein